MKTINKYILLLSTVLIISSFNNSYAQLDNLIKKITGSKSSGQSIDTETAIAGLKEALQIGTGNAVDILSITNGYFGNELVKILLPGNVKKIETVLRGVGLGGEIDAFVLSMNRAAESAAGEAGPIFVDAIKGMTINDALGILNGGDNAATNYFREKTTSKLTEKFRPIISKAMNNVGVTKAYKNISGEISSNPFISLGNIDLDAYVTAEALDGLFKVVAQEEAKIRKDPSAQVTDLLTKVFGGGK